MSTLKLVKVLNVLILLCITILDSFQTNDRRILDNIESSYFHDDEYYNQHINRWLRAKYVFHGEKRAIHENFITKNESESLFYWFEKSQPDMIEQERGQPEYMQMP